MPWDLQVAGVCSGYPASSTIRQHSQPGSVFLGLFSSPVGTATTCGKGFLSSRRQEKPSLSAFWGRGTPWKPQECIVKAMAHPSPGIFNHLSHLSLPPVSALGLQLTRSHQCWELPPLHPRWANPKGSIFGGYCGRPSSISPTQTGGFQSCSLALTSSLAL